MDSKQQTFEVEMHAFAPKKYITDKTGQEVAWVRIRTVTLPLDVEPRLGAIFQYGQNDFQPKNLPSVSVGDIIRFQGERWVVMPVGFQKVSQDFQPPADDRGGWYAYELAAESIRQQQEEV